LNRSEQTRRDILTGRCVHTKQEHRTVKFHSVAGYKTLSDKESAVILLPCSETEPGTRKNVVVKYPDIVLLFFLFFLFLCRGGFPRALRPLCGLLYIPYRHSTRCQAHTGAPVRSTGEPRYLLLTGVPVRSTREPRY
jgi:hypothetical protein